MEIPPREMKMLGLVRPTEKHWESAVVYAAKEITQSLISARHAMRPFVKILWPLVTPSCCQLIDERMMMMMMMMMMMDVTMAVPQVLYGSTCVLGDVCANDNAVCRNGRCQCRDGFGLKPSGNMITCGSFSVLLCLFSFSSFSISSLLTQRSDTGNQEEHLASNNLRHNRQHPGALPGYCIEAVRRSEIQGCLGDTPFYLISFHISVYGHLCLVDLQSSWNY